MIGESRVSTSNIAAATLAVHASRWPIRHTGFCTGLVAFKIDKGHCEKLSLDGLTVVATFYFPRAIHHGEGVLQPIIDERANDAQRDALFYILSGEDQKAARCSRSSRPSSRPSRTRSSRTITFDWDLAKRHCAR